MLKSFDLYIFDFDGTLVDTSGDILASVNHTRKHYGLPSYTFEQARVFIGIGQTALIEGILKDAKNKIDLNEAIPVFRAHQEDHLSDLAKFYPGVEQGLKELEAQNKKLAIVSNKYSFYIKKILEQLNCPVIFDVLLGAENAPAKKPDPAPLHLVAKTLAIPLSKTLMIGDSIFDILAGQNANVQTAFCTWGFNKLNELPSQPNHILSRFEQLYK